MGIASKVRRSTAPVAILAAALLLVASTPAGAARNASPGSCRKNCVDTTVPSVLITNPTSGTAVSGTVTVGGTAADNVGVVKVEVQVDSGLAWLASGTTSWSTAWDTSALANGNHTLTARATDSSGLSSVFTVNATVSNSDSTPPAVSISAPSGGSTVGGSLSVLGSASDASGVAKVEVQVDGANQQMASGTTAWSTTIDMTTMAEGVHTITAKASDVAGNTNTASVNVITSDSATTGSDIALADPVVGSSLSLFGRGRMAGSGSITALLYWGSSRRAAYFRDEIAGASSYVGLAGEPLVGWVNAKYVLSGTRLWVLGGGGPTYLREYELAGSPVPTSATLVSTLLFGDSDSRMGDLILLRSGALLALWRQHGATGPQGLNIAYRSPSGAWQVLPPLTFMPTASSKQVVVQHPGDGGIWVFNSPDAWSAIGAAHLTETPGGLSVDWTDGSYITTGKFGELGPDGENPDLAVAVDYETTSIVLAYQASHRQLFSTNPFVKGSYVSVARISAMGGFTFLTLPHFVERISGLGLVVRQGEVWLTYRPIDPTTLKFDKLYVSKYSGGSWGDPSLLGTLFSNYEPLAYSETQPQFAARLNDGTVHFFTAA